MKKIKIKLDALYCDLCSYDIQEIFRDFKEINSIQIKRKENILFLFLNESLNFDYIRETLELEGYIVLSVKEEK